MSKEEAMKNLQDAIALLLESIPETFLSKNAE